MLTAPPLPSIRGLIEGISPDISRQYSLFTAGLVAGGRKRGEWPLNEGANLGAQQRNRYVAFSDKEEIGVVVQACHPLHLTFFITDPAPGPDGTQEGSR